MAGTAENDDKGVISAVIPDNEMPHDEQGRPYEILANPLGIISRTNPTQIVEAALGKIVEKTGKPYKVQDFQNRDMVEFALNELKNHNLSDLETIIDPVSGRRIPNIMTGNRFFMKLHHQAESKGQGRGLGAYSAEETPARGGPEGSKKFAMQDLNAILSHGATKVLRDARLIRGQKNQEYWSAFMSGFKPPSPDVPLVFKKFVNQLRAGGVNVTREGNQFHVMELTDKDIDFLAENRELKNSETVDWREGLKPKPGGLFDLSLTGGHNGSNWSFIKMVEPLPNPVMEDPIRHMLGLTQNQLESIIAGKEQLNGLTGTPALKSALSKINIDQAIEQAKQDIASGRKTYRDIAIRKLRYLKAAKDKGIHPSEWILTKIPVLPPIFRPVSVLQGTGAQMVADANYLYKEVMDANDTLRDLTGKVADLSQERLNLYNAFKGVTGLGDPIHPKNKEKGLRGMLQQIFGSSPKYGTFQSRLLGTSVDLVGRAVITPNHDLDMDSIGIPENKAWEVYTPFIVRRLVRRGVSRIQALEYVKDHHKIARDAMLEEMDDRPVLVNRAPVLHRYGMMAFKPRLTKGDVLQVSPLIVAGMGADFDGNCLCFDMEIRLALQKSLCYTPDGVEFLTSLEKHNMLTKEMLVCLCNSGNLVIHTPIGKFPVNGEPTIDRNGAAVFPVPEGVKILSYDHKTGNFDYLPVTRFTIDNNHQCVRVRYSDGLFVDVSDNESLCIFDTKTGELIKKKPEDSVDQYSPIIRREPVVGTEYDKEIGWWYGALIADGWLTPNTVGYAKSEEIKRKRFVDIARRKLCDNFIYHEYYEETGPDKFGDSVKVHLNGKYLREKVFDCVYDGPGRAALRKFIPKPILENSNRDCLIGLLSGLIDGDGSLSWNNVSKNKRLMCNYGTSSKRLSEDLKILCHKLGLRCGITVVPANSIRNEAYVISISIIDLRKIAKEMNLCGKSETSIVKEFLEVPPSNKDAYDPIPINEELISILARVVIKDKALYSTIRCSIKKGYLTRPTAKRLLEKLPENYYEDGLDIFKRMVNQLDVAWVKVESVEQLESQDVFDFEVPGTKVFALASGLVVYDTSNYQVPADDEAKQEALEKMLPSRNLYSVARFKADNFLPRQEYVGGLYDATTKVNHEKNERVFATVADALKAFHNGTIDADTKVKILK